ncbi:hypothetical protein [Kitasatospora sp. NPDC127116]|uniref:hypothetical protein n=1 Tax=Kitasatospora sp. NPDC127116 TaxID=3345367 RepID=UPI003634EA3E
MPDDTSTADTSIASPLELIHEEEDHRDCQASELLLLSYTVDLQLLEKFALGPARAAGARVTVLGDADHLVLDPRSARLPGRDYLAGPAAAPAAFHPKLFVVAGPERATVAIGSGNTTVAGWCTNHELWTVLRSTAQGTPALFSDLAAWLRELPCSRVAMMPPLATALNRTADLLDQRVAAAPVVEQEARFVSSLHRPIIEQLPEGPVAELTVSAPFHDPGATALARLVARLKPRRLTVCYQEHGTELDGPAVSALLRQHGGELRREARKSPFDGRYRHGKLIEWAVDGQRWALTGSPNLSAAALLRAVPDGGNCEIGVIAPADRSLAPPGEPVAPEAVVHLAPPRRAADDAPPARLPRLLGAVRDQGGLRVWLARPAERGVELRLSHYSRPPEEWTALGTVPAGATEHRFPVDAEPGSRVGILGSPDRVPVTDVAQTVQRPAAEKREPAPPQPGNLFRHHALLEELLDSLLDVQPEPSTGGGSPTRPGAPVSAGPGSGEPELGLPLTLFALGRQAADGPLDASPEPDAPEADPGGRSWFEVFTPEEEAGLESDDVETEEQPPADESTEDAEEALRASRRKMAARLRRARADLPLVPRLLLVRVLLDFLAKDAWPANDRSWYSTLADVTTPLDRLDPYRLLPEEAESAASLAALVLAVLEYQAVGEAETGQYKRLASALAELLLAATEERIAGYVTPELAGRFGVMVEPDHVLELANQLLQDPVAKAVRELSDDRTGVVAQQHATNLLSVRGNWSSPTRAALDALGRTGLAGPVGAWACHNDGHWSFVAWHKPDLLEVTYRGQLVRWRHYRLSPATSPAALARNPADRRPFDRGNLPQLNETGKSLLHSLDLLDPSPLPNAWAPKARSSGSEVGQWS